MNAEITRVGFRPTKDARLNVEALTIDDLLKRAPAEHFEKLQRADFYRLIGVTDGQTRPMVDFSILNAQPGHWLLVRPGQVFRYDFSQSWRGWLLVFPPESLLGLERTHQNEGIHFLQQIEDLPCSLPLAPDAHIWMCQSMRQIQIDCAMETHLSARNELLRLQLANTLLRFSLWQTGDASVAPPESSKHASYRRFRALLEAEFPHHHQVTYYANALGMSEKTLGRLCLNLSGMPAKKLISQRLILEAKRLLAHSSMDVQSVGNELGFLEPTNFVKFFRKELGITPLVFRKNV